MRKHLIQFLLVAVLSACSAVAWSQTTVRGQLVDAETGEPLVGAAVMVEGTTQGSVTDIDGYFKQGVASNATLLFKYMGYKDLKKKVTQKGASVNYYPNETRCCDAERCGDYFIRSGSA